MKKNVLCTLLALVLILACGCSLPPLPDGYDAEKVESAAVTVLDYMVACDYQSVTDMTREDLKEALSPAVLEDVWAGKSAALGDYNGYTVSRLFGTESSSDGGTYGGIILSASFTNKTVIFTLTFDDAYQIVGLYIN